MKTFLFLLLQLLEVFQSLVLLLYLDIPIGITNSAIGLKICAIAAVIEKSKSIIQKKIKKHDQIVFLAKFKLNEIDVLIS